MNNLGFWKKLKKPIFCLAPMADVTDCAFRQIITKYGKPDVFWTEFVSADGLASAGKKKLLIDLKFLKNEHPIIAQIFGSKPENIKNASALCAKLGFDGVDINMGCPDRSIEKQNSGASMMKNPKLAEKIIKAAKEGASKLPISVKTRIGYNKNEINTWIPFLLKQDLAVLTVHLRTRKEMSNVPAHWDLMKQIVKFRNKINKNTLIIGNGDILNLEDGKKKIKESGCDGVMMGRAIFGNPFLFSPHVRHVEIKEKLKILIEHTRLFKKLFSKHKNLAIIKKHYKAYVNGFEGAKELRAKLMEIKNTKEVENIINDFLNKI
ncbi:MAG: tRNA-dihydrouridine synthase [Candidatus Paceibacterota bacterium]|jgi:nifR3 family TIM-barrel protein